LVPAPSEAIRMCAAERVVRFASQIAAHLSQRLRASIM
jgi:hypothetical protein